MKETGGCLESKAKEPYKSEWERQISRLLERYGISYRYEYPVAVEDRGKVRIWYPDFLLPEYGIVVECVGVNGDKDYSAQLGHKQRVYADLGIPVVFVRPEAFRGYWPRKVMKTIENILHERLVLFGRRRDRLSDCQVDGVPTRPGKR
jgi:hypothetical protein